MAAHADDVKKKYKKIICNYLKTSYSKIICAYTAAIIDDFLSLN